MWDDHFTQVEVGSEVKGFPKHVCEGMQVNNLKVGMIGARVEKDRRKRSNHLLSLNGHNQEVPVFQRAESQQHFWSSGLNR